MEINDYWGIKKTQEKQGIDTLKSDIKTVYKYGKGKVAKHRKFIKVKIEKSQARKVLSYMDNNNIEYEL